MSRVVVAVAIIVLTVLGWIVFPGHNFLRQDTQIYTAVLEHLWNPSVLAADPVAAHHHVTYTAYDELMRLGRWATGAGFEPLMLADQLLFRALGIFGVWLIGTALGLSRWMALLVAAGYAVGAHVAGPEVLTIEFEPKPRGSAQAAVLLAVGLMAHRRYLWGGVAAAVALLYHAPTLYPFLAVYAVWLLRPKGMAARAWSLAPLCAGAGLLWALSRYQVGGVEALPLLLVVEPEWEAIQRARIAYAWVETWPLEWIWHFLLLFAVTVAGAVRLRLVAPEPLRYFLFGLPVVGMLSLPASYLLLDQWRWAPMARFQPARALLFVVLLAVVVAIAAGLRAAAAKRVPEAVLWALAVALFFYGSPMRSVAAPEPATNPDLTALIAWAEESTPESAVFLFADAGRRLHPGVFRARALRAVYVDWKGGGQVNVDAKFAAQWWRRWTETVGKGYELGDEIYYRAMGIDYFVFESDRRLPNAQPLYENSTYRVYLAR